MAIAHQNIGLLQEVESTAEAGDLAEVYRKLRRLPWADFCNLHIDSLEKYPNLANLLPVMPSDEIQKILMRFRKSGSATLAAH